MEDIVKVTVKVSKTGMSTAEMTGYGAGAGVVLGLITGGKALKERDDAGDIAKKMGFSIAGGAVIGLVIGFFKVLFTNSKRTVYRK